MIKEDDLIINDIKEHVKDWTKEQFLDSTFIKKGYLIINRLI